MEVEVPARMEQERIYRQNQEQLKLKLEQSRDKFKSDLEKARKKLVAANAMESPKTIWISRRKPPDVSPKASERPVMIMTMTATMRATGPSIEARIEASGASHGMPDPAAWAGPTNNASPAATHAAARRGSGSASTALMWSSPTP